MKIIDVTSSHANLVYNQLANTEATLVRVYSVGKITVTYKKSDTQIQLTLSNKTHKIHQKEIDSILHRLVPDHSSSNTTVIRFDHLVEVTYQLTPHHKKIHQ